MKWYLDKGLGTLSTQLRDRFPGITIWSIGDADHQGGESDHNPEEDGSVDAIDIPINKHFTRSEAEWLFNTLITMRDKRISFLIFDHRIVSSTVRPWVIRDKNIEPHEDHLHLSVNDKHENDSSEWKLETKMRVNEIQLDGLRLPVVRYGESDDKFGGYDMIRRAQRLLKVADDGIYGDDTKNAVKRFLGDSYTGDGKKIDLSVWRQLMGLTHVLK